MSLHVAVDSRACSGLLSIMHSASCTPCGWCTLDLCRQPSTLTATFVTGLICVLLKLQAPASTQQSQASSTVPNGLSPGAAPFGLGDFSAAPLIPASDAARSATERVGAPQALRPSVLLVGNPALPLKGFDVALSVLSAVRHFRTAEMRLRTPGQTFHPFVRLLISNICAVVEISNLTGHWYEMYACWCTPPQVNAILPLRVAWVCQLAPTEHHLPGLELCGLTLDLHINRPQV